MVQLFRRYVPSTSVLDFSIQAALCLAAFVIASQGIAWFDTEPAMPGPRAARAVVTVAVLIAVLYLTGYYDRRFHVSTSLYVPRLLRAMAIAATTLGALSLLAPGLAMGWQEAASGLLLLAALMAAWHSVAPALLERAGLRENVLVLGSGKLATMISECVIGSAPWGFHLLGYVPSGTDDDIARTSRGTGDFGGSRLTAGVEAWVEPGPSAHATSLPPPAFESRPLGGPEDLRAILAHNNIQTVVVALADRRGKLPLAALMRAKLEGVAVFDAAEFYERLTGRILVDRLHPSSIIFSDGFSPGRTTRVAKRAADVVGAGVLLVLTAPLLVLIAAAVAATSPGPVLFRQQRVGLGGRTFTLAKFRTMVADAERDGPQWAATSDDRVTTIGNFLRRSRLDELPQLWNVLVGDMSFVGPRPERPEFVRFLRREIPYYDQRSAVRPGLTGWAQVKYSYGASVEESLEKLEFDLYYIKHLSMAFDVTIALETIRVLLTGKGAR